jgi:tetratricopeptide (TPR) repeat protein
MWRNSRTKLEDQLHTVRKNHLRSRTVAACCAGTVAALLVAAPLFAADQPKAPQVSAALQKPLSEAQQLLKDNKFPEAIDKLKAADATAGKTPYDQHLINQMMAFACSKTDDVPCLGKALQGQIDDGFTPPDDNQRFTRAVAQIAYQAKQYDQAIDYGNRAIKGGFATDETYGIVGASYYLKEDYKNSAQFEDARIADLAKQGKKPTVDDVNLYVSACAKTNDPCVAKALIAQLTYYPKPEVWGEAISLVHPKGDVETLQTYRLMLDVGAMTNADEYLDMANIAMGRGSPGDAQHALQTGTDSGALTSRAADARKLSAEATRAAASDQAALAKTEQEANAASNGVKNAGVGLAYLGYQQYDKAVDQLSKAVSKGGLKDEADTRLDLGIAQLKAGHKDDAIKTFQSVKGSPALEHLASLWVIHAQAT